VAPVELEFIWNMFRSLRRGVFQVKQEQTTDILVDDNIAPRSPKASDYKEMDPKHNPPDSGLLDKIWKWKKT
jgi:hypothetical protein